MEVKVLEMGENYVRLLVKGEDHTYLNLLQYYLLQDRSVIIAKYHIPHPLTGGKSPLEAIRDANERIIEACEELLSQI